MKRGLTFLVMFLLCVAVAVGFVAITENTVGDLNFAEVVVDVTEGEDTGTLLKTIMVLLDEYVIFFRYSVVLIVGLLLFNSFLIIYLFSSKERQG